MKYKLLFVLCLGVSFSFAQLTVRDANYVYVEDVVLFVTDDVNIVEGTSNIYLRNESQLVQGTGTTGNSGIGNLSIHQTGTANTYMYNYWCSPVGNINADNTANRTFIANTNLHDPIGHATDPHLDKIHCLISSFSTDYDGIATVPFTTAQTVSSYWLYTYNPGVLYSEWDLVGSSGDVTSGYGFTMKGNPSGAQKYDFRGKPNNGEILTAVQIGEETLVGNPYPSALDTRDYIHETTNATLLDSATLSFWEQNPAGSTSHVLINYRGGYATYTINASGAVVETYTPATFDSYNADGTLNTTGVASTSGKTIKRYISVGQGFMVKGKSTGNLKVNNSMRNFEKESAGSSEFFRTSNSERTDEASSYTEDGLFLMPEDYKRFRLNLDFNETYTRQLLQNFHHTATAGEDYGLETLSPDALNSDAYWPQGEKAYNAQAFSFELDLHIPIVININQDQPFRFRIFDVQNFDEDQPIFVHDIETDIYLDLRQQNYEINLPQGNYTDRFEIVFQDQSLSTEEFNDDDFLVIQNNNSSQLTILNPNQLEVKSITLFDVSGKRIFNESNLDSQDRYDFPTKNLSDGVYITKVTFANQSSMSKKVVVSQK